MSIAKELNYSMSTVDQGTYTLQKVRQQSGVDTATLTLGGGDISTFEIPPQVVNLAKSSLSFTATYPVVGAGARNYVFSLGTAPIRSIQLITPQGLFLADLTDAWHYTNAILPYETQFEELASNDVPTTGTTVLSGIGPNNGTGTSASFPPVPADNASLINGLSHVAIHGANGEASAVRWNIPLSKFKHTILAHEQDLWFGGQSVFLRVTWNASTVTGMSATDAAYAGPLALTVPIPISGLYLLTAIETNPVAQQVARSIKSQPIEYTYTNQLQLAGIAGGLHSVQVRLNRSQGSYLKKLFWVPYVVSALPINTFKHCQVAGALLFSDFHTTLNNSRIEQFNVSVANKEDYLLFRDKLKGSCLAKSTAYHQNWLAPYDFTSHDVPRPGGFFTEGIDLSEDLLVVVNSTNNNTPLLHFVFAVCERTLTVDQGQIILS